MISVPLAGTLPSTPRPVRFMNGSITSSGKPYGYVGIACGVTIPISSQWPVVVSLPRERSSSRPAIAGAPGCGAQPSSGSMLPRPSASSVGRSRPPTARATLPRVSDPSSPNSAASGSAPAPTASSTITHARGTRLSYFRGRRPRTARDPALHRLRDRPRRGRDLARRQDQPAAVGQRRPGDHQRHLSRENVGERRVLEAVRLRDRLVRELAADHVDALRERRVERDRAAPGPCSRSPRRRAASRS